MKRQARRGPSLKQGLELVTGGGAVEHDLAGQGSQFIPSFCSIRVSRLCSLLCRADDKEWRKDFFHSEYTMTNSQVHPPRSMTDEAKEHAFYKWMARQQLYYKDLLKVWACV